MTKEHAQPDVSDCGLAENKSLRYLSLDLPEDRQDLLKPFHEAINKYRPLPIYIAWRLYR